MMKPTVILDSVGAGGRGHRSRECYYFCLQGMARAKAAGFVDWLRNPGSFDAEAYLHYEQVQLYHLFLSSFKT